MEKVLIKRGTHRNDSNQAVTISNFTAKMVKPLHQGAKGMYLTVDSEGLNVSKPTVKVRIDDENDVEVFDVAEKKESKAEAIERIRERFEILDQMTDAVATGVVRGLIVSGPPGVGKSFGVETILDDYEAMHRLEGNTTKKTEVVKGSMTPIGLYQTLYMNSDKGNIIVFDDCDSILFDEVCLNMLKAVLDSGKKRTISWKSESSALRREGSPDRFNVKGGVLFITNVNFENVRSKKIQDHLAALMSRCHYIDLEMDSERDRFLRIEQIVADGMLNDYSFDAEKQAEIVNFMKDNAKKLREISLRMVLKLADLAEMSENWQALARSTCMKRG